MDRVEGDAEGGDIGGQPLASSASVEPQRDKRFCVKRRATGSLGFVSRHWLGEALERP